MKFHFDRRQILIAGAASLIARPSFASSHHDVEMLNKHPEDAKQRMVFLPRILVVQPGDVVKFLATDKGHNSEIIKDMMPEGAEGWKGKINEEIEVTLTIPGFYGYKCTPHLGLGMVGLVVVQGDGMMDNLEAAQAVKQRGKAKKAFEEMWAALEAEGILSN